MEKKDLEAQLKKDYPSALRIVTNSSSFDFGPSAKAMYVYNFGKTENSCSYKVLMIQFGKNADDAYNRAVAAKNTWGGTNAVMTKLEAITF